MLNMLRKSPVSLAVGKPASKSLPPLVCTRDYTFDPAHHDGHKL